MDSIDLQLYGNVYHNTINIMKNEFSSINNYLNLKISKILSNKFLYSPYSISYMTFILYLASTESTKDELGDLFGIISKKEDEKICRDMIKIHDQLLNSKIVKTATLFCINHNYIDNIKPLFYKLLQKLSMIYPCDFLGKSNEIIGNVNNWVSMITNGMIKSVISLNDISGMSQILAFNVIYFKSNWLNKFDTKNTNTGKFTTSDNKSIELEFMNQTKNFNYYEDTNLQMVELPYIDDNFVFGIFLPKSKDYIVTTSFDYYIQKLSMKEVYLTIPKFTQTAELNLKDVYYNLDCKRLFQMANAELYNLITDKDGLYVSEMKHKAIIIIDETGTEAAAVTTVEMRNLSLPTNKFIADHPFQYYIRYRPLDLVLFHGFFDQ